MPKVHRKGDMGTGHGCFPPRASVQGSPNVYAKNIQVHRVTDAWATHCCDKCHGSKLCDGSPNVFANNLKVGRKGDPVCCGSRCAEHSPDVIANGP